MSSVRQRSSAADPQMSGSAMPIGRGTARALRQNSLGPLGIAFLVLSAAAPLVGIAGGLPVAMLLGNGAGMPASFAAATLILLLFAVGYTAMAPHVRNAGAFYAFAARGLGGFAGGATAIVALISYCAMLLGLYALFGSALAEAVSAFTDFTLPWGVGALVGLAVVAFLGYRRVDLSARILAVLVACEYLVVLYLDTRVLLARGSAGLSFSSFTPAVFLSGSPWIGLLLSFSAFVGFEATAIYSEEARDPARSVPVATYLAVIVLGLFYLFSAWCVVVAMGASQVLPTIRSFDSPTTLLFTIADHYAGHDLALVMRAMFLSSVFAGLLAFHNAVARYGYALGREGLLPALLGETHPRHGSPHVASVAASSVLLFLLLLALALHADPLLTLFGLMTGVGTLGVVVLMAVASASVLGLSGRIAVKDGRLATRVAPALAELALLAVAALAWLHFDALSGVSGRLARVAPLAVPVAAVVGFLAAVLLRFRAPERFARLGANAG